MLLLAWRGFDRAAHLPTLDCRFTYASRVKAVIMKPVRLNGCTILKLDP